MSAKKKGEAVVEGISALWDLVKAPLARPTAGQAVDYAGTKLTVDISPRALDTPEGMQAFIDKYGRKPLHAMDQNERTITFAKRPEHADLLADPHDLVDVGGVQIPGGLDGTFNLSDMFYLKNSGINPRELEPALHAAIHKKMLRSVTKESPTSALEQFDRLGFGITSGNAPLTKNEIEWAQLRPRSEDELRRLGESYPGSSAYRDGPPAEYNKALAESVAVQSAGAGGTGVRNTADYSAVATLAQDMGVNPQFFQRAAGEDWAKYVERVSNQARGLGPKTGSLGIAFTDPAKSPVSAIDRHIADLMIPEIKSDPAGLERLNQAVLAEYNRALPSSKQLKTIAGIKKKISPEDYAKLETDALRNYVSTPNLVKYRDPSGNVRPEVPAHLRSGTNFPFYEPEQVQVMPSAYRIGLKKMTDEGKPLGLEGFGNQWFAWDRQRQRLEPHELFATSASDLPRLTPEEYAYARQQHSDAGYFRTTKDKSGRLSPATPRDDWRKLAYWGVPGATVIGAAATATAPQQAQAGVASNIPDVVRQFGKTISGWHYSKTDEALRRLDPTKYGKGAKGAEAGRLDADTAQRTFFYAEGSRAQPGKATPRPEDVVGGGATYRAKLNNIYDLSENPLGLKGGPTDIERQIKEAGFNGYTRNDVVVNFYPTEVERIGAYRSKAEEALERSARVSDEPNLVTAEVIPSKDDPMGAYLLEKPASIREAYTDQFGDMLDQEGVMRDLGISDYFVRPGYGAYQGNTNPNLIVGVNTPEEAKAIADTLGYASRQEAVPYITRVGDGPVGVTAQMPGGVGPEVVADLNRATGINSTRTALDRLDAINFDGMPDDEFIDTLGRFFEGSGADVRKYRAGGDYNSTQHLWESPDGLAGVHPGQRETLRRLRSRVEEHNKRFRKQYGYADPRALAATAALSSLAIGAGALAPDKASAFAPDQYQAIPVGSPRPTERQNLSFLAPEMYRQMEETRRVLSDFATLRAPKASFWQQKRQELADLVGAGVGAAVAGYDQFQNKVYKPLQAEGYIPEGTPFADFFSTRSAQSQEPVRAVSALAALVATQDPQKAAGVYRMHQEQIADEAGGLVTDYLAQAGYPGIAPAAGTAVNVGINMAGF